MVIEFGFVIAYMSLAIVRSHEKLAAQSCLLTRRKFIIAAMLCLDKFCEPVLISPSQDV